ncbi:MAG: hypothetical protein ACTHLR_09620 [Rhizomicrobium sp.]
MWRAPFTGGHEKTLPSGLRFVVTDDSPSTATAISADPYPASKWEVELVEAEDRSAEKYGGYYLVIPFGDVTKNCILIS